MAFGVLQAEFAASVGGILEGADDRGSGGYGAGMDRIGVGDHDVDAAGFDAAELGRGFEAAAILVVFLRAEHDHAASEGEFGVADGSVFAFIDGMALEADDLAEPVDGGGRVAVAQAGDNR